MCPCDKPFSLRYIQPLASITIHLLSTSKTKSNEFKNKEKHLDTDSESNYHRSHRRCRRTRPERLYLMIMRTITLIIIHCSATPEGRRLDFETCRRDHIRHRGFTDIGYHFYITRDGEIHRGRPLEKVGAHCKNHNRHSIGICYEGGLSADCTPADTRTLMQKGSMLALLRELRLLFPKALIVGHHDLNPVKPCPCFDAVKEYRF